ncbi:MAG: biotin--[acetyl-CoA-carboxylase] ligase [Marinifilaceae bacterium]
MSKLFPPHNIIRKNELDSTNNHALKLIQEASPSHGTVVLTVNQTKGRGQRKNYWESEGGKNLTISLILRPEFLPIHLQFGISKVISLGVADFLGRYTDNISIKWPNDIYVGEKKIAGILIEHSIMGSILSTSVCGIGLNINQREFLSDAPNPVSLALLCDKEFDLEECLTQLLEAIETRYQQLEEGQPELLDQEYLKILYRKEGYYPYEDANGRFEARIAGISPIGQFVLETREGDERTYNFKEVKFL